MLASHVHRAAGPEADAGDGGERWEEGWGGHGEAEEGEAATAQDVRGFYPFVLSCAFAHVSFTLDSPLG